MEKLVLLTLIFGTTVSAFGEVSTRVCRADGNTPLELADPNVPFVYRDIMVGTKLTVYVDSNVAEYWYGGALTIEANMIDIGRLYGRDCDGYECPGSCLPDAGEFAYAAEIEFPGYGVEFYGGEEPNVGEWFVVDYNAIDIGDCNVAFYDYDVNDNEPINILSFHHVRTCDFNGDTKVDCIDFTELASFWLETSCIDVNDCNGTDLNIDGKVDKIDLALFTDFWLEKTQ